MCFLEHAVLPQRGPLREAIIQACEIREEAYRDMACQSKKVKMMLLIFLCFWVPNLGTNLIYRLSDAWREKNIKEKTSFLE